jgi:hypothetical protein
LDVSFTLVMFQASNATVTAAAAAAVKRFKSADN